MSINTVILGASGTIGEALARSLLAAGNKIFLISRHPNQLADISEELGVVGVCADCSSFEAVDSAFLQARQVMGQIDAVVNCCGSILLKPASLVTEHELTKLLQDNLFTSFASLRAGVKYLAASGGSIVLFSSAASQIGLINHEAISAVKSAINGLVVSAAASYAGKNIRVNAVAPGLTQTKLTENIFNNEQSLKLSARLHGLNRFGSVSDLTGIVEFLISNQASWITGQVIGVDGGLAKVKTIK